MARSTRKPRCTVVATLAVALAAQPIAHAGNGTFQNGKYKFCASVRFNATSDQLARIRAAFTNGSQVLADATDGQQAFGTIKLVNNSGGAQAADYWIHETAGRAYATYGQYGVRGQHVNMFYPSNFTASSGADGDAYTIAHEHAHHSWGVADEYSGPGGNAEDAPAGSDTASLNYSLMDNYFTRGGRAFGGAYTLNEFCTAANHDPDHNTWQHAMRHQSVWETIASHPTRAAVPPQGLPTSAPPAAHTVDFSDGNGARSVMLLLDRSGSMDTDGRLASAQQAANQFVGSYPAGDGIGAASFSDAGSVDYRLAPLTEAGRAAVQAAVSALSAGGSTNIGGGLLTALGELTSQVNRSCDEVIILLSDGDHNTGTPPETGLAAAQAAGVTVMSVGLGGDISTNGQATLQNIAVQTGGKFYSLSNPADLYGVFLQLSAETSGQGVLARVPGLAAPGQVQELPVTVEAGANSATFGLALNDAQDAIALTLKSPSGKVLRPADVPQDPSVKFLSTPNSQVFQVARPEPGSWTMLVTPGAIVHGKFEAIAFAAHDGVQLNAWIEKDRLAFPDATDIRATPTYEGQSVLGATIDGEVRRPDGTRVPIQLFDDGVPEHGDTIPNDGVYGARFSQYQGDGTYTFELRVSNSTGRTYAGEALFADQPANDKPVPPFARVASTTAVVSGVPESPVASVEYGPETLNMESEEQFITLYIELAGRYSARDIDPRSVRISAVNGVSVRPLYPIDGSAAMGDADDDGIADLRLRFNRDMLQNVLQPGSPQVTLEGTVDGQGFVAEWTPRFVNTGKTVR